MLNRLEMLRIFLAAADTGSFKDAAVRLGISPQAVTRAVQELERIQADLLFHRNTRQVRITAFGEELAERARDRLSQIDALFVPRKGLPSEEFRGIVRLTAPKALGRLGILPLLADLAIAHPGLRIDLGLSDTPADVVDERIDIGVRFGAIRDSRFIARKVATYAFHVVGTPALIARVGEPTQIQDLEGLPTTVMNDVTTGRPWPWWFVQGQYTPSLPTFASNDSEAERDAVLGGLAFGQIAGFLADEHIAAGRLIPVLEKFAPHPWDLYVYRPQRGPVAPRVRLVFDQLVSVLGAG
ncbi:LysR family transcriptional regulator [Cupriavidus pauculus]|uniref:LysR family transcriptional regulator n=1 Tax=Cupriavidus pauculus TaxID=82633 RepID=A0A2N5CDY1_9BURK|nr:LysR family transcriptional regulator [Cupriavidus pauculus]PLQ00451.1 LysR family transcriptional regulator [Cupriavidus pauculus]